MVAKVRYINGYGLVERDEVIQSVISNKKCLEDSFGLARAWYIRDLGCLLCFTQLLATIETLLVKCVYIYIYTYIHILMR